jgi:cytochrome c biogenesis protein CcmG/thiol:disulfide interchange protein DsbE
LSPRRRVVAVVAATVVAGAGLGLWLLTHGSDRAPVASLGRPAPPLDLPDVRPARPRVVLAGLRGTPVLVNFWATWCGPCRKEMPLFAAAAARLGSKVAIVGVDVKDNREAAERFLAARGAHYPSAYDPEASTRRSFTFVGLPVTVLVGRDGRVLDRVTGEVTRTRLDGLLERAQAPE